MNNLKTLILLIVISTIIYALHGYKKTLDENKLVDCVETILSTLIIENIQVDAKNRIDSPIITGKTTTKNKKLLIQFIIDKCDIQSFEDLIVENNDNEIKTSNVNFKLDSFNQLATITGMVNSVFEQQETLTSFTQAVNKHYGPWTIEHEILVSKDVKKSEFAIDITLIFTAISSVRVTDITLSKNQLILKGYIRDESQLEQILLQLNQIFQDDLEIINHIIPVLKDEDKIKDKIKIEPMKFPDIKPPTLPDL